MLALTAVVLSTVAHAAAHDTVTFRRNSQRTGWDAVENELTPRNVTAGSFGELWQSPPLDTVDGAPPHFYASPLYMDRVRLSVSPFKGRVLSVLFAASNAGYVYAVNAFQDGEIKPGTILWKTRLAEPCTPGYDGVATGAMSTPVIDPATHRLYVTSCTSAGRPGNDGTQFYQAYALDITRGGTLPGWPVILNRVALNQFNQNLLWPEDEGRERATTLGKPHNGPLPSDTDYNLGPQRGALNLSPDGSLLYATFGESIPGWLVAIDTRAARIASAFASVARPHGRDGGIWGVGGPAIDVRGAVFVVVGTGFNGFVDQPHDWVQSLLMLSAHPPKGLVLRGTYTPFNYCQSATVDADIAPGGAVVIPDLDPVTTQTPHLLAFGGKQGNLYLVNRAHLPGSLETRAPCSEDSSTDRSLLPPTPQPQFGKRGPLNVFGPYSEVSNAMDQAKSRSVPAHFRAADGEHFLFVTGSSKRDERSDVSVPPSVARVRIVTQSGQPAYLKIDQVDPSLVLENPGSPVITSAGSRNPIVWILDENGRRTAPLTGPDAPHPMLYALDAMNFRLLWKSKRNELSVGGKYNEPAVAHGVIFVATDRIQAFGLLHKWRGSELRAMAHRMDEKSTRQGK